jgi:hypothetical protein
MFGKLRHLWHHHPVALLLFGAASVLVVVFALRVAVFALYWSDPDHRHHAPEPWMTPGFVAHAWHVPKPEVFRVLGYDDRPRGRQTLEQIAAERGVPVSDLISALTTYLSDAAPRK